MRAGGGAPLSPESTRGSDSAAAPLGHLRSLGFRGKVGLRGCWLLQNFRPLTSIYPLRNFLPSSPLYFLTYFFSTFFRKVAVAASVVEL